MSQQLDVIQRADTLSGLPGGAAGVDAVIGRSGIRTERDRRRGRASAVNPSGRFEPVSRHVFDDGWQTFDELPPFDTRVTVEKPRTIITRNESPDATKAVNGDFEGH